MYVYTLCIFYTLIFSKIYFLQFFGRWKLLDARRSVRAVFAKQRSNLRPQRMQHQHMHKHKYTQTCADVGMYISCVHMRMDASVCMKSKKH